jgi:hypothetical protein
LYARHEIPRRVFGLPMAGVMENLWRSQQPADRGILDDPAIVGLGELDLGAVAPPDERVAGRDGVLSRTHCCPRPLPAAFAAPNVLRASLCIPLRRGWLSLGPGVATIRRGLTLVRDGPSRFSAETAVYAIRGLRVTPYA